MSKNKNQAYRRTGKDVAVPRDALIKITIEKLMEYDSMSPAQRRRSTSPYKTTVYAKVSANKSVIVPEDVKQEAIHRWQKLKNESFASPLPNKKKQLIRRPAERYHNVDDYDNDYNELDKLREHEDMRNRNIGESLDENYAGRNYDDSNGYDEHESNYLINDAENCQTCSINHHYDTRPDLVQYPDNNQDYPDSDDNDDGYDYEPPVYQNDQNEEESVETLDGDQCTDSMYKYLFFLLLISVFLYFAVTEYNKKQI